MRVTHINNINFSVSRENAITCTSTWELVPDGSFESSWTTFEAEIKAWIGSIGDAWRVPTADSKGYTADETRVVTNIDCSAKARWCYEVRYTGRVKDMTERLTSLTETINNREEHEKTATYQVETNYMESWCPAIGDLLAWAGELFCCDNISKRQIGVNDNQWEVTITAVDMRLVMLGNPTFSRNSQYESVRTAVWRVHNSAFDEFISGHDIGAPAAWAGENYYITDIQSEPRGNYGHHITLEAKHIAVRCIEIRREESLTNYNTAAEPERAITYTGTWQVQADAIAEFENLTGGSAAAWAGENYIVTKTTPTLVSPMEYEVVLEAMSQNDWATFEGSLIGSLKPDYSDEIEVYPHTMEIILTPAQLGWIKEKPMINSDNITTGLSESSTEIWKPFKDSYTWMTIDKDKYLTDAQKLEAKKNQWDADKDCPFLIPGTGFDRYVKREYANKPFQCICVDITQYTKGDPAKNLSALKTRIESYPRIIPWGDVRGLTASWKRIKFEIEKVKDSKGNAWWRETYTMMAAPQGWRWNPNYVEASQ